MTKQERRVFTEEFKREAVCLLETSGRVVRLRRLPKIWASAYQR